MDVSLSVCLWEVGGLGVKTFPLRFITVTSSVKSVQSVQPAVGLKTVPMVTTNGKLLISKYSPLVSHNMCTSVRRITTTKQISN